METLRILATGSIVAGGEVQWNISPLIDDEDEQYQIEEHKRENPCSYPDYPSTDEVAPDGTLQRIIDEGEMTAEYEDDIADRQFWARGEW
jgi:hypothetical protein